LQNAPVFLESRANNVLMPVPAFSSRLRMGAFVLLASALPLVVQVPASVGPASVGPASPRAEPAAWLRAHVQRAEKELPPAPQKQDARAHFDQALAEATDADTRTLHDFLKAFLEAHARLTGAEAPTTEGRTTHALLAAFRQQLAQSGLAVRSPIRLSVSPTVPPERARWMRPAVSLLVPLPDRSPATTGTDAFPPPRALALGSSVGKRAVSAVVARGSLFRTLFAGRRLGP
jgi:hypothetical protein